MTDRMNATGMGRTLKGEPPPNPGSEEAQKLGCKCAVMDNCYGKGFPLNGKTSFWINGDCKLHG